MKRFGPSALAIGVAACAACSGQIVSPADVDGGCFVIGNRAPDVPTVVEPAAGRIDVLPAQQRFTATPYADADGNPAKASEWEIWRVQNGQAVERVWSATVADVSRLDEVHLSEGTFEVGTALADWQDYQVTVRYRDAAGCGEASAFSPPRGFRTDDGSSFLYAESEIRDLYLDIPQASIDAMNAEALPPGCVPYERNNHPGTLRFGDQVFADVGLKIKGGCGSARTLDQKPALKVSLDWDDPDVPGCPKSRRLFGEKHLTLNNQVQDPSAVHERLAYTLYKLMGVPSPRAAAVRLFVNGTYWGLYLDLETVDRRMLERWFASSKGMMYEGTYFCDLLPANVPASDDEQDDTKTCLGREFSSDACSTPDPNADPTDYSLLRQLTQQIAALPTGDGFYPEVAAFFDFDTFLSSWAVDAVIGHWDGYEFGIMNNYRVYHDPSTGRWTELPSGVDQTFGDASVSGFTVQATLATKCLADPDCAQAFAARLHQVVTVFQGAGLDQLATQLRDQISSAVADDPHKEVTFEQFTAAVDATVSFVLARPDQVLQDLASHGF